MLVLIGFSFSAWGSSLQISPLRIDLNAKQRIEIVTLTNRDDEPLNLQLGIKRWRQSNGNDSYSDTHEILVTPPIIRIAPNKQQIIRVGLIRSADFSQELSYRLYVTEIPGRQISPQAGGEVRIISRIGIPIFVNANVDATAKINWRWQAKKQGQNLYVSLNNLGNQHIKILGLLVKTSVDSEAFISNQEVRYVLPKQMIAWILPLPNIAKNSTSFLIEANTNKGWLSTTVTT